MAHLDVSVLLRSTFHTAHKISKPSISKCNRKFTITSSARHFRRESLFSKGTEKPEDVVQRCLVHFRKCDLPSLSQYLPRELIDDAATDGSPLLSTQSPPLLLIGNSQIQEQGPLASLHPILDIGARRVLPGHLLRRSRVLGSLRLSSTDFQQQIAITAQTGEESVFIWNLRSLQEEADTDESRTEKGRWVISKIQRESEEQQQQQQQQKAGEREGEEHNNRNQLPSTPQPKSSPEAVVYAQLEALRRGDVYEASQFNTWRELSVTVEKMDGEESSGNPSLHNFSLGPQFELLRDILGSNHPYTALLNHSSAVLGPAALPTQRSMLQEVWVKTYSGSRVTGEWVRFVWNLSLESSNGCWMCTKIEPFLDT